MKRIVITLYDHTDKSEAEDICNDLLAIGLQVEHIKVEGYSKNCTNDRCDVLGICICGTKWDNANV